MKNAHSAAMACEKTRPLGDFIGCSGYPSASTHARSPWASNARGAMKANSYARSGGKRRPRTPAHFFTGARVTRIGDFTTPHIAYRLNVPEVAARHSSSRSAPRSACPLLAQGSCDWEKLDPKRSAGATGGSSGTLVAAKSDHLHLKKQRRDFASRGFVPSILYRPLPGSCSRE